MVRIKLTIKGLPNEADNGEYVISDDELDGNDLHVIREHSNVRLGQFADALNEGDYDLVIALAHVAMQKAGREVPLETLMALKLGSVRMDDAADPAAREAADKLPLPSAPDSSESSDSSIAGTGDDSSSEPDDSRVTPLRATGSPDSDTGSDSDHAILAT